MFVYYPPLSTHVHSVTSVVSDSWQPSGLWPARLPDNGVLQARILEWVAMTSF